MGTTVKQVVGADDAARGVKIVRNESEEQERAGGQMRVRSDCSRFILRPSTVAVTVNCHPPLARRLYSVLCRPASAAGQLFIPTALALPDGKHRGRVGSILIHRTLRRNDPCRHIADRPVARSAPFNVDAE